MTSGSVPRPHDLVSGAVTTCASMGLALSLVGAATYFLVDLWPLWLWLLPLLPLLVLQDLLRYIAYANARPVLAVASNGTWLMLLVVGYAACRLGNVPLTATSIFLIWAIPGASAGMLFVFVQGFARHALPSWSVSRAFMKSTMRRSQFYLLDGLAAQAHGPILLLTAGAILGLSGTAALRSAQLLISPLSLFLNGARVAAVPEFVRLRGRGRAAWIRGARVLFAVTVAVCALWGLLVLFLPMSLLQLALGDSAVEARVLLPGSAAGAVGAGIAATVFVMLRSLMAGASGLVARLGSAVAVIGAVATGATTAGLAGLAAGLMVAAIVTAGTWLLVLRVVLRKFVW
ncbi:hypothetical protein BKA08_001817 [Nocardioides marinisabuli]|uniref:Uncharacterized protein n=1 Tax=Nocardioides marinisabuli TaxID=419476 RepID=A0A7Y9JSC0_9ACTN|nr:hypothetical protein [Nocardioides marinisabuli]